MNKICKHFKVNNLYFTSPVSPTPYVSLISVPDRSWIGRGCPLTGAWFGCFPHPPTSSQLVYVMQPVKTMYFARIRNMILYSFIFHNYHVYIVSFWHKELQQNHHKPHFDWAAKYSLILLVHYNKSILKCMQEFWSQMSLSCDVAARTKIM